MSASTEQNGQQIQPQDQEVLSKQAQDIGWAFVSEYYKFLSTEHTMLHRFYTSESTFLHGTELDGISETLVGQLKINQRITAMDPSGCKIKINTIDMLPSIDDGVILQVIGGLCSRDEDFYKKFVQTFFLAKQVGGYYVRNDVFRYLVNSDENDDNTEENQVKSEVPSNEEMTVESQVESLANQATSLELAAEIPPLHTPAPNPEAHSTTERIEEVHKAQKDPSQPHEIPREVTPTPDAQVYARSRSSTTTGIPQIKSPSSAQGASLQAQNESLNQAHSAAPQPKAVAMSWADRAKTNMQKSLVTPVTQPKQVPPIKAPALATQSIPHAPGRKDNKIFAKGVTMETNADEFRSVLLRYGRLREFDCVHSKACAFVDYEDPKSAEAAIEASLRGEIVVEDKVMILGYRKAKSVGTDNNHSNNHPNRSPQVGSNDSKSRGSKTQGNQNFAKKGNSTNGIKKN